MQKEDGTRFKTAIGTAALAFDRELLGPHQDVYWEALKDLTIEQVEQGIRCAIQQSKFFPKPAEIRELAGVQGDQKALKAWGAASDAVGRLGPWKHVSFDDGVTNAVIRMMGGWPTFCARFADAEDEMWTRKEFLKSYGSLSSGRLDGEACRALAGLAETSVIQGRLCMPRVRVIQTGLDVHPVALEHRSKPRVLKLEDQSIRPSIKKVP